MIKLINKKKKAIAIRLFWSWYIYLIPTIMTEYHSVEDSCLNSLSIGTNYSGEGNNISINLLIFVWQIDISYWWDLTERKYT